MRIRIVLLIALAVATATIVSIVILTSYSSPQGDGIVSGVVRIGPLCPVEPCPSPTPDVYSSREVILQPQFGEPISINLDSKGNFQAQVRTGRYSVTLTDCAFLGCDHALPIVVNIEPNKVAMLEIEIDTGIR